MFKKLLGCYYRSTWRFCESLCLYEECSTTREKLVEDQVKFSLIFFSIKLQLHESAFPHTVVQWHITVLVTVLQKTGQRHLREFGYNVCVNQLAHTSSKAVHVAF